jgi:hypothetical protein
MSLVKEITISSSIKKKNLYDLIDDPVVKSWDQKVYFPCDLRFEPCGC